MSTPIRETGLPVHLWIYNHSFYGISDQIEYFLQAFRQHGYVVSVGRKPHQSALNVVIENFSAQTRNTLIEFCTRTRKRVAMIMTEHIDFVNRNILIHGDPFGAIMTHESRRAGRTDQMSDELSAIHQVLYDSWRPA